MGRDRTQPTGQTVRVKGGQNWRANSLPQKPGRLLPKGFWGWPPSGWLAALSQHSFNRNRNQQDCPAVLSSGTVTTAYSRGLNRPHSDLWNRDRAAFRRPILGEDLLLGFL